MLGLQSPRRRRRLVWGAGLALPLIAAAVLVVVLGNTGESLETPVETGAVETPVAPAGPPMRVTPAVRRRVDSTVDRFTRTAVIRRGLDEAWALASPTMKAGLTRAQWRRGELPVQPYSAAAFGDVEWRLVERYPRSLLLDVAVHPKQGFDERIAVYSVELSATGRGASQRFLVDTWVPLAMLGDVAPQPARGGGTSAAVPLAFDDAELDAIWLLVPAAIGGLLVLTLAAVGIRGVLLRRRAERTYREHYRR